MSEQQLNAFNARLQREAEGRAERVLRLREAGESWQTIGSLLGISKQRAYQLATKLKQRREGAA